MVQRHKAQIIENRAEVLHRLLDDPLRIDGRKAWFPRPQFASSKKISDRNTRAPKAKTPLLLNSENLTSIDITA
ncbi:MAG: hypothetical protein DVB23_001476 [Verrucomicrobia bacterium]|nr:MAG: hypothetical protein DVB23_001476 [Verrucomicrobiota bacterium]